MKLSGFPKLQGSFVFLSMAGMRVHWSVEGWILKACQVALFVCVLGSESCTRYLYVALV